MLRIKQLQWQLSRRLFWNHEDSDELQLESQAPLGTKARVFCEATCHQTGTPLQGLVSSPSPKVVGNNQTL